MCVCGGVRTRNVCVWGGGMRTRNVCVCGVGTRNVCVCGGGVRTRNVCVCGKCVCVGGGGKNIYKTSNL